MKLVKQKQISPRKMWPNEQLNFTPWLVDNIEELGEKIGMDLEVVGREVSVGPYSADILAKDTNTNDYVVIENQLEKTNHDHLGKTITYASALNAKTIIWIATVFTEEHKKAFEWLNDNTNEDLAFWAIQLELWQITENTASMRFNIVCMPSSNVKTIKRGVENETETKKIRLDYWTKFYDKLDKTKKFPSLQSPSSRFGYDISLGRSGIHLSNFINIQKNIVAVRLYIHNQVVEKYLPALEARKDEINSKLGCNPEWVPNPNSIDKSIAIQHETDLSDPEKVEESLNWMVKQTIIFREVFTKEIKGIK